MSEKNTGRVTIPTNLDVVPETIELMKRWGADAIRDCDGTEFPEELTKTGAKIYATYYTTRKDNEWAKANPDEVQQCYIMSGFYTAVESELQIPLMKGISDELMQVNTRDDIKRWWEVVDRSTGQVVSTKQWEYNEESGCVCIADQYTEEIPEFVLRLKVKAGLTGYAQVYGKYNTTPYDKLKLDLTYIENYSVWMDIKILFLTFKILFQKENTEGVDQDQTTAIK